MKKLLIVAAVLALGVSALTPPPAVAAMPTGKLVCKLPNGDTILLKFGGKKKDRKVVDAVRKCRNSGGHPAGVLIDK